MMALYCRNSFRGTSRRIFLLLWKNLILRKRHYIITVCEIVLPILFSVLMSYARTQLEFNPDKEFNSTSEDSLIENFTNQCENYNRCLIVHNPYAKSVVDELYSNLSGNGFTKFHTKCEDSEDRFEESVELENDQKLLVGIFFNTNCKSAHENISYTLRFPDYFNYTDELIPKISTNGPNIQNANLYSNVGFTGLQILIDRIIIKQVTNNTDGIDPWVINTQPFPYPKYASMNEVSAFYTVLLPQFVAQSFIFVVPAIMGTVLSEKETGVKELMKIAGFPSWMHWLGWTLNSLLVSAISASIIVCCYVVSYNSNQAYLAYIEPTLWWLLLILYIVSGTSFTFFISAFFEKPLVGTVVGIIVWLVSYYGAVIPLEAEYRQLNMAEKMLLSLFPNMGLYFALKVRSAFEAIGRGANWENFMTPISSLDPLSFGYICIMFATNTIIYITLTVYFENVIPTKFGVRKPWYFLFKCKRKPVYNPPSRLYISGTRRGKQRLNSFEKAIPWMKVGIELQNLCKVFGSARIAVDNLSLKMFEGQITVIMGENGAGKTSVMSLLTGLIAPTGGTAFINGHDIATDMELIRENLGFCPQQNMLFARLTVFEHLMFFGRLKGVDASLVKLEIYKLMEKLQLSEKAHNLSMSLSGGQKRKLSLGCALIGGSQILILDEPTSAMDPKARRAVLDLLLEMRPGRTIVITTQFMEEADILGDRIAILCDGKLQCYGSPSFLKKCYGDGYTLKLILSSKAANVTKILSTIQKHIPNAALFEKFIPCDTSQPEVWAKIPLSFTRNVVSTFPSLFADLSKRKHFLGIVTIGLSYVTMDEVFNRVMEIFRGQSITDEITILEAAKETSGILKFGLCQSFRSLFQKRIVHLLRKRFIFICQLITPMILVAAAIHIGQGILSPIENPVELHVSLESYKNPITLYYSDIEIINLHLSKVIGAGHEFVKNGNFKERLFERAGTDLLSFREQFIVAINITTANDKVEATAMFSTIAPHASPLAVNLITNTALLALGSKIQIKTINHPVQNPLRGAVIQVAEYLPSQIPIITAVFLSIGMGLLASSFVVFPTEERLSKVKHLQLMTGTTPLCYWGSLFCCDFIFSIIAIGLMTACFPVLETYGTFTDNNGLGIAFLVYAIYTPGAIIFSYLVSLFVGSSAVGFSIITTVHMASGMGFNVVTTYFDWGKNKQIIRDFQQFFRIFPSYGSTSCAMTYVRIALANRRCHFAKPDIMRQICHPDHEILEESLNPYRFCCKNCVDLKNITGCFSIQPYLEWTDKDGNAGIGQELVQMSVMSIIYAVVLFAIEYRIVHGIFSRIFQKQLQPYHDNQDAGIVTERQRVEQLLSTGTSRNLIIHKLFKKFGKANTVSNINLAIQPGECFGLLGLNGAGKSTILKMITGFWAQSSGNVLGIQNESLTNKRKLFLSRIGYCPQVNSIIGVLTGREMLELFCRLRDVPQECIRFEVAKWLSNTGLSASADTKCRNYSGGMKRRLCTAIAMIGDPPIIVLDEPTSGVDPIARRQIWNILKAATNSGQAIIMTSHSLEECEFICSRVGILVNGEFRSIGSVSHLKHKFSQGFSLIIKLKCVLQSDVKRQRKLDEQIKQCFQPSILKYQNQNIMQYELMNKSMTWSVLFKTLEGIKVQFSNFLDEYSVFETTLEQVLLSMSSECECQSGFFTRAGIEFEGSSGSSGHECVIHI